EAAHTDRARGQLDVRGRLFAAALALQVRGTVAVNVIGVGVRVQLLLLERDDREARAALAGQRLVVAHGRRRLAAARWARDPVRQQIADQHPRARGLPAGIQVHAQLALAQPGEQPETERIALVRLVIGEGG